MRSLGDTQKIKHKECRAGWHMPELLATLVLMRLRQENGCKFEANLCCRIDPVSKRTEQKKCTYYYKSYAPSLLLYNFFMCTCGRPFHTCKQANTNKHDGALPTLSMIRNLWPFEIILRSLIFWKWICKDHRDSYHPFSKCFCSIFTSSVQ